MIAHAEPVDVAAERDAFLSRSAGRGVMRRHEVLLRLARPGATRDDLVETADSHYSHLLPEERAHLVALAERHRDEERTRTRLNLEVPMGSIEHTPPAAAETPAPPARAAAEPTAVETKKAEARTRSGKRSIDDVTLRKEIRTALQEDPTRGQPRIKELLRASGRRFRETRFAIMYREVREEMGIGPAPRGGRLGQPRKKRTPAKPAVAAAPASPAVPPAEPVASPAEPAAVHAEPTLNTAALIAAECDRLKDMLLTKNRRYGDSALNPLRIFSQASPEEQINVRIDDKLSRLVRGSGEETEDVEQDLLGYLVLKQVYRRVREAAAS